MQNKEGIKNVSVYVSLFITGRGDARSAVRKESFLSTATSGSRLHPSSPPVAGPLARSSADYDRAAWSRQLTAVTRMVPFALARWTRGTGAGAFPLAPPTICQHADRDWKASGESCVRRWAGVAQRTDPWLHFQTASERKVRNGWRWAGDVCSIFEEEALKVDSDRKWSSITCPLIRSPRFKNINTVVVIIISF